MYMYMYPPHSPSEKRWIDSRKKRKKKGMYMYMQSRRLMPNTHILYICQIGKQEKKGFSAGTAVGTYMAR